MADVTREQALVAARVVYGPSAYVEELQDDLGCHAWAPDVGRPMAGTWPRFGSDLRELIDGMAQEYASGCRREAEPWFAAGGQAIAREALRRAPRCILADIVYRLERLQEWVADAEERVYRAAGLPGCPSS